MNDEIVKKGPGRPKKIRTEEELNKPKGKRGRPRKYLVLEESAVKRGRGRPRKYDIMEREISESGEVKTVCRKVDSGHLVKQLLNYFTKLLILHSELSKDAGKNEVIFTRLKNLDFQMCEICKTILTREYAGAGIAEGETPN